MNKQQSIARHKARKYALQAIYQWQYTQDAPTEIERQFHEDNDFSTIDTDYFSELVHQIPKNLLEIDDNIKKAIDRPLNDLNQVELAVLRIAVYELLHRQDVPYKVVINEALQITKTFGSKDGFKYVNGVLDNLAKNLRSLEVSLHRTDAKKFNEDKGE